VASNYQLFAAGAVLTQAQVNNNLQRQAIIQCDAAADRTALPSVEGMMAYQKDTDALWIQAPAGTWVQCGGATTSAMLTYTPQVDQGASTNIAKTVREARYIRMGCVVKAWVALDLTAGGTAGSQVTMTLPVTASGHTTGWSTVGSGELYDASGSGGAGLRYAVTVSLASTTTVAFAADGQTGVGGWGASPNAALATSDQIRVVLTYTV
jgi:hypothetical protein